VNPKAVAEAHLFQPIKQGGFESGVAVIAVQEADTRAEQPPTGAEGAAEHGPDARSASAETRRGASVPQQIHAQLNAPQGAASAENRSVAHDDQLAVYTAKYRLTLKGADRGKWDFDIHVEADAPLVQVDKVVQGVQRRSGDAEDPERLSGDQFRALLPPSPTPLSGPPESTLGQSA
jgi:hypothetical protein